MRRGWWKFWERALWENWAADRRQWRSYKAAIHGLDRSDASLRAITRPARPWSPVWVPGLGLTIVLFLISGMAAADQASVFPSPTSTTTLAAAAATTTTSAPTTTVTVLQPETATVASITDGDTIRVLFNDGSNEPVRLIGIDAPESNEPFAVEATDFLASLVEGQAVYLVPDVSDRDRFGRLLRYVYVGERFINREMVENGLAMAAEYPPDTARAETLEQAERQAEQAGRGQWSVTPTTFPPTTTSVAPTATTAAPTTTAPTTTAVPSTTAPPASNCHTSYEGACLMVGEGDYDCAGGSGNGPNYVNGPIRVVGYDEFDLDRDGDGVGCDS